jgi:hypothetical protein
MFSSERKVIGATVPDVEQALTEQYGRSASPDVLFFPVGNQDVRKFVFWDRRANQIHIYAGSGKFEETWQVGTLGQDLKKR